jgi:hypothetical protein
LTDFSPENVAYTTIFNSGVCVDKCPGSTTEAMPNCQDTETVPNCSGAMVRKTFTMLTYCVPDFTDTTSFSEEVKEKW